MKKTTYIVKKPIKDGGQPINPGTAEKPVTVDLDPAIGDPLVKEGFLANVTPAKPTETKAAAK